MNNIKYVNPRVSIIVPVYNTENYLPDCLNSLLNQTLKEIEIICVDDGSTDNSLSILKKYSKMDNRIIVLEQENKGGGMARNFGMSIAKGEYLIFLDSDDFFNENLLYETVKAADNFLADIVICLFKRYNNTSGNYLHDNYGFIKNNFPNYMFNYHTNPNKFFQSFTPATWNKLFRHSFIKEHGLYFQDNKRTNDLFFTISSLTSAKKIYFLDKPLVYYRIGLLNNCQSTNALYPFDFYKALLAVKKFLKQNNLFQELEISYKNFAKMIIIYNLNHNDEKNILIYEHLRKEGFKNLEINIISSQTISKSFHEKYEKYLDNIYFKNINIINNNFKVDIIKKIDYLIIIKVSVIISVYNVEKSIKECLDSISKQTLRDIEIICVNDGSTDNSLNIIKEYAENDNRIQIISQINRGLSEARNTGVSYSKGEYIYFINGDDYLELNALLNLYNNAIENNLDIVLFDAKSFLNDSNLNYEGKSKFFFNFYTSKNNYSQILNGTEMFIQMKKKGEYYPYVPLLFVKKEFYINTKLSFYPGILYQDNLFTLIALLNANKTKHINQAYYNYRVHDKFMTDNYYINNLYSYLVIYSEIIKLISKSNFKNELKSVIINEIIDIENKIFEVNKNITEELKNLLLKKITIYQEIQYKNIIQKNEMIDLGKKFKNLEKKYNKLKKKNSIYLLIISLLLLIFL